MTAPGERVLRAQGVAEAVGFRASCDDEVGRLLAVLAAAVPRGGRILELGTGAGVGLAWLTDGLGDRVDVTVTSVERDATLVAAVAGRGWPAFVEVVEGDALDHLAPASGDLVFADAAGGKLEALDRTIEALRPGGILVVDDMARRVDDPAHDALWPELERVRETLLGHRSLVCSELRCGSGVLLCASSGSSVVTGSDRL